MSNAWRQLAQSELNRLLGNANSAGLLGLTKQGITLSAAAGPFV